MLQTKLTEPTFSYLEVEAAMCVWEHIDNVTILDKPLTDPRWVQYREDTGSAQLRHESIEIGQYVLKVFALIPDDIRDGHSYDWDIVPAILATLEWESYYAGGNREGPVYRERYVIPTALVRAAEKAIAQLTFEAFLAEANGALYRRYKIEFTNDAGMTIPEFRERFYADENARMTPEELAAWYGEKYGLTEAA